ncbi:MAG TPA: hypothetical protein VK116_03590 [Planctomycetota bacterium]|nr:hypothetical protein [Planctomycetota bacterium]
MARAATEESTRPSFFKELYAFVLIGLLGATLALYLVPPKARRYWSLIEHETRLEERNRALRDQILELREATESLQNDPFFREAVLRERLDVKRRSEQWLPLRRPPEEAARTEISRG